MYFFTSKMKLVFALLFVLGVEYAQGHGFMRNPMARHALWALPANQQPANWWDRTFWDSQGVWCGNIDQNVNVTNCGRCGDPPGQRNFDLNAVYGHPVITGTYNAGQTIRVDLEFGAMHFGYMFMDLCAQENETDGCFTHRLRITGGSHRLRSDTIMCLPLDGSTTRFEHAMVQLPAGVRCNRCTLRWTYRTSYPGRQGWDACANPTPTQVFRGCANIRIN